jgi:prepilin-type N-terminal cleavage/methylation domain-containing protein
MKNSRGFTLIEVLAVLAIMGILAALLTPAVGTMLAKARRARVSHNLRQIALAYASCVNERGAARDFQRAQNVAEWAAVLARHGGITDASLYAVPEDRLAAAVPQPRLVLRPGSTAPADDFSQFPLALTVIVGTAAESDPSTTPLAYTRGLDPSTGRWKPAIGDDGGVYGTDGGFLVFLDGHVEFFTSLADCPLVRCDDGQATGDIREAVGGGSRAINWRGTVWSR